MSAAAFCTVTASTKRNADLGSGRTGAPTTNLASLAITPLWPAGHDTIERLDLGRLEEMLECWHVPAAGASLPDVEQNDVLVVASTEYRVQAALAWTDGDVPSLQIVVAEVR